MNKRFWIATVLIFVVSMFTDFLLHGLLLHGDYARLPNIMRTESDSQQYFPLMLLAHAFIAVAFVWIYMQGRGDRPWLGQGFRFGLAVAFLTAVPTYMIYFAVQPLPEMLVVKQIAFDLIRTTGLGVLVGWTMR
ncbi:MAG: hypothetical protein WCV99_21615 [Sterolibacterium sp.]|jgi:hypothetical protein